MVKELEKSLEQLMSEAYYLSLDCAFETLSPCNDYWDARTNLGLFLNPQDEDKIWAWCDGLMAKYYDNHLKGHCSIQAMIDFDLEKFEQSVVADIEMMNAALKKLGSPRKMTFEEMQKRGYRGSGAGYTKLEDCQFYLDRAQKLLKENQDKWIELEKDKKTERVYDEKLEVADSIHYYEKYIEKYTLEINQLNKND